MLTLAFGKVINFGKLLIEFDDANIPRKHPSHNGT
jgi:hypothetical protein